MSSKAKKVVAKEVKAAQTEVPETVKAEVMPPENNVLISDPEMTKALEVLEAKFFKGISSIVEMSNAIEEIKSRELYKVRRATFDEYVTDIFKIGRAYAYRLLSYSKVRKCLALADDTPVTESLLRPLTSIKDESSIKAIWSKVSKNGVTEIKPDEIKTSVANYKKAAKNKRLEANKRKDDHKGFYSVTLGKRVVCKKIQDVTRFIIDNGNGKIDRIINLFVEFAPHMGDKNAVKNKIVAEVKRLQKKEYDTLCKGIGYIEPATPQE